MSVFIRMTGGAEFRELLRAGEAHLACYRRPDGSDVLVAWTEKGSQRVSLSGQLEAAVDIMGADRPLSDSVELTEDPVYLVGRALKIDDR